MRQRLRLGHVPPDQGRTNLWALGWKLFLEQPFSGYGAYAGTRFTGITDVMEVANSSILNTWFEAALGVGIPGTLLVLGAFWGVWIILLKCAWLSQRDTLVHCDVYSPTYLASTNNLLSDAWICRVHTPRVQKKGP